MDVFISYSTKDKAVADDVCSALENSGIKCWIAPRNIQPGTPYARAIINGITSAKIFLLVLTPDSNDSEHVINEVDIAFNAKKTIIPFFAEEVALNPELNYYVSRKQWLIAYPDYKSHLDKLVVAIADNLKLDIAKPSPKESPEPKSVVKETSNIINGHEYVDLGLPSGLKWATCNVGASKPEEYGGYYAWGELEVKREYTFETYVYKKEQSFVSRLFGSVAECEFIGSNISKTKYDVAHVKWGGSWRMPSYDEQDELCNECTWIWTSVDGVNGYKVIGPNGNSIFLPASGYRCGTGGVLERGDRGYYWLALFEIDSVVHYLTFSSIDCDWTHCYFCYCGCTVRPVSE